MKTDGLNITIHAHDRFKERLPQALPSFRGDIDKLLMKLLKTAERGSMNIMSYLHRQSKHDEFAVYYSTKCGWRFVVIETEGSRRLVTVERRNYGQN